MRAWGALAALLLAACTMPAGRGGAGGAAASAPLGGTRDERVLLTSFAVIPAVSASRRTVYVATDEAIAALDRGFDRWRPPLTRIDGYPGGPISAMAADPMEDAVWIAVPGRLLYYRPDFDLVSGAILPGVADQIVFDARDLAAGAFVHTAGGWSIATRTGLVSPASPAQVPPPASIVRAPSLRDVLREYPSLPQIIPLLTRDEQLRSWPVLAAAKSPDISEVWLGTRGGGLFEADPVFMKSTRHELGPIQTGTGALAAVPDGIWMAGLGGRAPGRGGLTFASSDLRTWRWVEGSAALPLAAPRAYRLAVRGSVAWVATDRGLARVDVRTPSAVRVWSAASGLPADETFAVAAAPGGAWAGTARGLAFVSDEGAAARLARTTPLAATVVRALLLAGDTLWAGTDAGLLLVRGASPDSAPRRPAAAAREPRLTRPVLALAGRDTVIAVATDRDLLLVDPRGVLPARALPAVDLSVLQGVSGMAMDDRSIWISGSRGVLVVQRASGAPRLVSLPAPAYDVALEPGAAWVATAIGVLRLQRLADGGVR